MTYLQADTIDSVIFYSTMRKIRELFTVMVNTYDANIGVKILLKQKWEF